MFQTCWSQVIITDRWKICPKMGPKNRLWRLLVLARNAKITRKRLESIEETFSFLLKKSIEKIYFLSEVRWQNVIFVKIRFWTALKKAFLVVKLRFFEDENFARLENSKIPVQIASLGQNTHFSFWRIQKISSESIFICENRFLAEIRTSSRESWISAENRFLQIKIDSDEIFAIGQNEKCM